MKILVLDEFLSYPVDSGKKVRTYNILKQLSIGHQLLLLTYVWGDRSESKGLEHFKTLGIEVATVQRNDPKKSGLRFYAALFRNMFSKLPFIVDGHLSQAYADRLQQALREFQPEVVMAEWSPYSIYLRKVSGPPRVAIAHNLESSIWRGYVEKTTNPLKKAFVKYQYGKVRAFEDDIFSWLDGLIAVSPLELKQVRERFPNLQATLVDNGVDTDYFAPGDEPQDDHLITFCGSMDWRPNQDAVQYTIEAILPSLRKLIEPVQLLVVGRQPPARLVAFGQKHGVEFTGSVDDVRPYVRRSALSIVPLRIGGGSRLKILEALSMKKAVVSTALGAEGLNLAPGRHIAIADQPDQFAQTVAELLNDKPHRQQMAEAGHRQVIAHYRWEELAKVQAEFLESLARK